MPIFLPGFEQSREHPACISLPADIRRGCQSPESGHHEDLAAYILSHGGGLDADDRTGAVEKCQTGGIQPGADPFLPLQLIRQGRGGVK